MISNASGRSALILTAALFALIATPVTAATDGDDSASGARSGGQAAAPVRLHRTFRHAWHHRRHYVHRRIHTIAKADDDDNDNDKKAPDVVSVVDSKSVDSKSLPATLPPQVANANAQMLLAGVQLSAAAAIPPGTALPTTASETANADSRTVIAVADQLNDADRTLQEGSSAATSTASPPAPAPAPVATTSMTGESTVWDQTSLIGKIFIGFGALLTMASAARMFIT
jgi:hypothetical protein